MAHFHEISFEHCGNCYQTVDTNAYDETWLRCDVCNHVRCHACRYDTCMVCRNERRRLDTEPKKPDVFEITALPGT
ncbi:MAG: hypothetical protein KDC35_11575 [Acidobacteria bacterium]|nr:hypothetical protein [Acidobacteriota bacterium]